MYGVCKYVRTIVTVTAVTPQVRDEERGEGGGLNDGLSKKLRQIPTNTVIITWIS